MKHLQMKYLKMNRTVIVTILFLFLAAPFYAEVIDGETIVPQGIRNNQFYLESLRLTKLAQDVYEVGDYEASAGFAEEAIRFANLSDEHVADKMVEEAKRLLDWADHYNISALHPNNYRLGRDHYINAVAFHSEENWIEAVDSAGKSIEVLSVLLAGTDALASGSVSGSGSGSGTGSGNLSRQYTVRTWAVEKDCFWNIAGYSWVYGDVWQWQKLYEANKHKIPDPDNPDLVEPGTILDIPR